MSPLANYHSAALTGATLAYCLTLMHHAPLIQCGTPQPATLRDLYHAPCNRSFIRAERPHRQRLGELFRSASSILPPTL